MAPHNVVPLRPPGMAELLRDLGAARRDYDEAISDAEDGDEDAADRADQADRHRDALLIEFAEKFERATGLTLKEFQQAISEAVI